MKVTQDYLKDLEILKGTKAETVNGLCMRAVINEYDRGTVIFGEQDVVNFNYIVLAGKVIMSKYSEQGQKRTFYILGAGEVINEVIYDKLPASVECEVYEDALILQINKDCLLSLMKEDFEFTKNMMNSQGKKVRRLYRQLKNTVPIKLDRRLAAKLWKLSRDYGEEAGEWTYINLKISVTELSYMLGTSRETLSRSMKVLKEKGLIKIEGKKIFAKSENLLKYFKQP